MIVIGLSFLFSITISLEMYYTSVLAFKRDAESGKKCRQAYVVTRKEYFPITDQYFVRLNNKADRHYEVSKEAYDNCKEGEVIFMDQTIRTKYIFTLNDHIITTMFHIKRGTRYDYHV
jgi:hypothetical protein